MKTLFLDAWDSDDLRMNFYNMIEKTHPNKVVFLGHQELSYLTLENLDKIVIWHEKQNKIFHITTLSYPECNATEHPNIKVYHWIDWYFKKIFYACLTVCKNMPDKNINYFDYYKKGFKLSRYNYFLTSLNYRGHRHRSLMIDLLEKNDLIKNNAIAWHNIPSGQPYNFKYFQPKVLELSNNFSDCWISPPDQYYDSFVQLISESSDTISCFSEKTVMALICHKPFLIAGPAGIHEKLKGLGFKLFDELFDYSFDTEQNEEKRYQMIMDNMKNLQNRYVCDNGKSLKESISEKLLYNFEQVKKIAFEFSSVPGVLIEFMQMCDELDIKKSSYNYEVLSGLQQEKQRFLELDNN